LAVFTALKHEGVGYFFVDDEGTPDKTDYLDATKPIDAALAGTDTTETLTDDPSPVEVIRSFREKLIERVLEQFPKPAVAGQD
jgi:hypothetical protein